MFNQEELKNILALVSIAPIKGADAMTVAFLQQKINALLVTESVSTEETKK